jgi:WhiB family transcriptional regulator, redox-sensing transcriptional regulator
MSDFRSRAACSDVDPELFFPIGTGGPAQAQTAAAKAVCRRCAVTLDCLSWALSTRQDEGIWGGLDATERRQLRRPTVSRSVQHS